MNKNSLILLRIVYCTHLLTAVLLVAIFELQLLPTGMLAHDAATTYAMEMAGVVLTIISIPVALKMLNFPKFRALLKQQPERYTSFSLIRLSILGAPLLYDTLAYYFTGLDATLGYLGLMVVVAFLFVWPSRGKMEYECDINYSKDEK